MMKAHWQELSTAGRALVAVIGARLIFGLYLALNDHFSYHDTTSAVTVLAIYVLLGGFTAMFLYGKRSGLWLLLGLSTVLIIAHTVFAIMDLTGATDAGLHGVANNPWPTVLRYVFFLATLGFGVEVLHERPGSREGSRP
jgi:hypothetical protein